MQLKLHAFDLPLRHTFTISRESITSQPTLIVELTQDGVSGYGEATSNKYYGFTIERMARDLAALRAAARSDDARATRRRCGRSASRRLKDDPFALCALDQAAHDLWGKLRGQPVWKLWGLSTDKIPASDYTIGIDTIEKMVAKMKEIPGWPIYKIKLGTDRDLEIVRELRQAHRRHLPRRCQLRLDGRADDRLRAGAEEAGRRVHRAAAAGRPLGRPAPRAAANRPCRSSPTKAASWKATSTAAHGVFHGINIKLVKCGGLTPARRMIAEARELGLKVMVGCMTESTVGISAIAQLLPLLDYVDMDGAVLLAKDIADGVRLDHGRCIYPDVPGNGVTLHAPGRDPLLAE